MATFAQKAAIVKFMITPTAVTSLATPDKLICSFRIIDYKWGSTIWFAAAPRIMATLESYGTISPTTKPGVYELNPHPLVIWSKLMDQLEEIDGMTLE